MDWNALTTHELASLTRGSLRALGDSPKPMSVPERQEPREDLQELAEQALHGVGHGEALGDLPVSAETRYTLRSVFEEFSERCREVLRRPLRCEVECRCENVVADTFAAYMLGMDFPTAFEAVAIPPLSGKLLLELPLALFFPLAERFLGWSGPPTPMPRRPLTRIERRILERTQFGLLDAFAAAWSSLVTVHPTVERIESNPRTVRCLRASEPILIATFELRTPTFAGRFKLALPISAAVVACEHERQRTAELSHLNDRQQMELQAGLSGAGTVEFSRIAPSESPPDLGEVRPEDAVGSARGSAQASPSP